MSNKIGTGGAWKRPISRMYSYNYQVGENYYHPMTTYLDGKYTSNTGDILRKTDIPGAMSFRLVFIEVTSKAFLLFSKEIQLFSLKLLKYAFSSSSTLQRTPRCPLDYRPD